MSDDTAGFGVGDAVFEDRRDMRPNYGDVRISRTAYYAVIVAGVFAGYGVMAGMAVALRGWLPSGLMPYIALLIAVFVLMILGGILAVKSNNWIVSLFAYLGLVAAPFGSLFGPFVKEIGTANVVAAAIITACVTVILGLIGLAIPTDLGNTAFRGFLTVCLWIFVVMSFVTIKLQLNSATFFIVLACVGIVLFGLMLIFDFNRSKFIPSTLDNAVDVSLFVFLDSLNLLLRIASILARLKGNNN